MTTILTEALRAKLLENGQAQRAAIRNGSDEPQPLDPYPVVHEPRPDQRLESPNGEPAGRRSGRSA